MSERTLSLFRYQSQTDTRSGAPAPWMVAYLGNLDRSRGLTPTPAMLWSAFAYLLYVSRISHDLYRPLPDMHCGEDPGDAEVRKAGLLPECPPLDSARLSWMRGPHPRVWEIGN